MRFTIEQRFAADADAVARAYADPALYAALAGLPKLARARGASATQSTASIVRLQVRYRFGGDLSSAARAVIDPARLTWVEHTDPRPGRRARRPSRCSPDHYADRLRCQGTLRFEAIDGGGRRARLTG